MSAPKDPDKFWRNTAACLAIVQILQIVVPGVFPLWRPPVQQEAAKPVSPPQVPASPPAPKKAQGTGQITTGSTSAAMPCISIPDVVETLRKLHPPPGVERPAKFKNLFAGRETCGFTANLTAQAGLRLEFANKSDTNVGSLPTVIMDLASTQKGRQFASGQKLQAKGGDCVEYVVTQEPDADRLYIRNARIID